MDLIVETDIGHDPDDFFALCYLIASGVDVRTILISPGDPDQVAITKFLCKEVGLNIPIGFSHTNRNKLSSGSIHHALLKKYKYSLNEKGDDLGINILKNVVNNYPNSELFVIGPVTSIGKFIGQNPDIIFNRATMQGGFCPYSLYQPVNPHPNFMDKSWVPTFNLNGDRPNGLNFLNGNIKERRMVGKNICHTVLFDKEVFSKRSKSNIKNVRAWELFEEAANLYFENHDSKKFHDPTAAACHLYPKIGTWVRGKTIKMESGWTTEHKDNADYVLCDINYEELWNKILF